MRKVYVTLTAVFWFLCFMFASTAILGPIINKPTSTAQIVQVCATSAVLALIFFFLGRFCFKRTKKQCPICKAYGTIKLIKEEDKGFLKTEYDRQLEMDLDYNKVIKYYECSGCGHHYEIEEEVVVTDISEAVREKLEIKERMKNPNSRKY